MKVESKNTVLVNKRSEKLQALFLFHFFWNPAVYWGILPSAVILAVTGKMRIQQEIEDVERGAELSFSGRGPLLTVTGEVRIQQEINRP